MNVNWVTITNQILIKSGYNLRQETNLTTISRNLWMINEDLSSLVRLIYYVWFWAFMDINFFPREGRCWHSLGYEKQTWYDGNIYSVKDLWISWSELDAKVLFIVWTVVFTSTIDIGKYGDDIGNCGDKCFCAKYLLRRPTCLNTIDRVSLSSFLHGSSKWISFWTFRGVVSSAALWLLRVINYSLSRGTISERSGLHGLKTDFARWHHNSEASRIFHSCAVT